MENSVFEKMLARYNPVTKEDKLNATHEVMQEIVLAGLYKSGFFGNAAFYGGTCLRIFHGLQRFSEDLDFSLLKPDEKFSLENYFEPIITEFNALGREVSIVQKKKNIQTNIESAFLKDNTEIIDISFTTEKSIKIKLEVDTNPPTGFMTEQKLLLLPFSFMVRCYTLSDLFAGKMHALLFRKWKNRVKGRDWYDFEWYVRNNVSLNFNHLKARAVQLSDLNESQFTFADFKNRLKEHISATNIETVKSDVQPFIKNPFETDIWSTDYFVQLVDLIKVV